MFENCSANYSNHLHTSFRYHFASTSKPSGNASILLYRCLSVNINNITVIANEGNTGILVVNIRNYTKISNIHIIVQANCLSVDKSLLQTNGILLYYDNWKNPAKKSSEIQLNNFQFTTNGLSSHPIYYAIKALLFQDDTNVSVILQSTIFTNLTNVTALYYYGIACGTGVSSTLLIENCTAFNNIGSHDLNMFSVILKNSECIYIRLNQYTVSCDLQSTSVIFTNCTFENNFNMSSMIYVSPVSSRSIACYLQIIATSFHSNRNVHLFIMRNDEDNIWQLSSYIWFRNINITSNVHDSGQDLISFTNSMVWIYGPFKIMNNKYYINALNFHLSIGNFKFNINVTNNTVRHFLTGTFIIINGRTTITITRNTVYILLNQIRTYSINSEPICSVQFYAGSDIFNVSKFLTRVVISSNVHMTSTYLPKYDYRCRWLVGSAFQRAGLKPKTVYGKLLQIKNNTVIGEHNKRPIPLSICKCMHPNPWSSPEMNSDDNYDCYSSHLGSIFPGQTLEAALVVKKQWPQYHNFSSINIVVHSTENDDCNVVNTFQLSQTHLDPGCNNYSYTLWPKTKSIKVCKFFIGLQSVPEMFYVQFKPCPLGFTLQDDKKSCYCDPVLSNYKVISIKSCNLNDETVLRPAYSWISATRSNITNFTPSYIVSSYCPFQRCLPYQSHLKLSNPDSQCQFNRTGLLCGRCQQGLSTVFGSHQCKRCSNAYLLLAVPFTIAGVVFVALLYIFDLTVRNGMVNTCIFYINILDINILLLFPNCESFICVALSYMNLEFRNNSCFYNGMDDYAKLWLYFSIPSFLIAIATILIILSRYSVTVQRLTSKKALPVLATLLLFSYIKLLIFVCNILFQYSNIIHLPSN